MAFEKGIVRILVVENALPHPVTLMQMTKTVTRLILYRRIAVARSEGLGASYPTKYTSGMEDHDMTPNVYG